MDFRDENEGWNWNWTVGKTTKPARSTTTDFLRPGDLHPAWVPQIFNVGYTKPKTSRSSPKRPEISGPFQLTSATALPTAIRAEEPHVQSLDEYERPPPPPPVPFLQTTPPALRRAPSQPQTRNDSLPRSTSSSPTSFKRARLPSVFGKLKRSATTSNVPLSISAPTAPVPPVPAPVSSGYDNPMRQGWVLVDASRMKQARQAL